mgnify:CR=1 FL=1
MSSSARIVYHRAMLDRRWIGPAAAVLALAAAAACGNSSPGGGDPIDAPGLDGDSIADAGLDSQAVSQYFHAAEGIQVDSAGHLKFDAATQKELNSAHDNLGEKYVSAAELGKSGANQILSQLKPQPAIDPKTGAKTIDPAKLPDPSRPLVYCPGPSGARSWPPTSFSKNTGLLYVPLTEQCMGMGGKGGSLLTAAGSQLTAADHPDAVKDGKMGRLQAMDINGEKLGWTHDLDAPVMTSALSTAGGVVFAGDLDPSLKAFDDRDGKLLWSAKLDNYPSSSVITYSVGPTQYVAVVTGMTNNHINDISRRYIDFRKNHNLPANPAVGTEAAVQVFKLGK